MVASSQVHHIQSVDLKTLYEVFVSLPVHNVRANHHIGTTLTEEFGRVNLPGGKIESLIKMLHTCILLMILS
jgi:hypothetical protein